MLGASDAVESSDPTRTDLRHPPVADASGLVEVSVRLIDEDSLAATPVIFTSSVATGHPLRTGHRGGCGHPRPVPPAPEPCRHGCGAAVALGKACL